MVTIKNKNKQTNKKKKKKKQQQQQKNGWEYLKTLMGILRAGIFHVGVFLILS